ncbi:COP9 signalosome complex subunit 8-like [Haliotis rufescens]|uniref:COP9 signalosome complex subunit 8-like n=1 Tax=Haliotis rufescens TaxID=6454 RepID=UPI00201EABB1|nr:COP9 signalosome complex subunit 8-like [Haliotis rufescens]
MAVEVKMNFEKLQTDLENQELEAPGGVASFQVYGQLLGLYLLHNDTCNAKFLWKRIPQTIKSANPELSSIWIIGQKMWQRDYPGVYETVKKEWSEPIKPVMMALFEAARKRAFELVALAYSSINADELSLFVGLPVNDAVKAAVAEGWEADAQTRFLIPKRKVPPPCHAPPSEHQLAVLTDYVSFLEN